MSHDGAIRCRTFKSPRVGVRSTLVKFADPHSSLSSVSDVISLQAS